VNIISIIWRILSTKQSSLLLSAVFSGHANFSHNQAKTFFSWFMFQPMKPVLSTIARTMGPASGEPSILHASAYQNTWDRFVRWKVGKPWVHIHY